MAIHLVNRAIEEARDREPLVRAMVLIAGARVLAAVDKQAAREAFNKGAAICEGLQVDHTLHEIVVDEVVRLGAAADPVAAADLFRRLPDTEHSSRRIHSGSTLVYSLMQNGEVETALTLLEDLDCETGGARAVFRATTDPVAQRRALVAVRERWRVQRNRSGVPGDFLEQHEFHYLFSQHWRQLGVEEAHAWLDEILLALEADPDHPTNSGYGEHVQLHSTRDAHLFEVLNVIQALKPPEEVAAILQAHPHVAEAAKVLPLGLDSLRIQPRPPVSREGGFVVAGAGGGSYSRRGDSTGPQHLLEEAHHLYLEDMNPDDPNVAPRVFWPSCHAYRTALYWAGVRLKDEAEPMVAQVPDTDIALLASIELAAGAMGLGQHPGMRMEHHPGRFRSAASNPKPPGR